MTFENKAKAEMDGDNNMSRTDCAILLGMSYIADAVQKGFKRLSKVIDKVNIEVQDEE